MLNNGQVYDFKIIEAVVAETQTTGRAYIRIKLEEKKSKETIFDNVVTTVDGKIPFYGLNHLLWKTVEDKDLQFLVGKESRLRVKYRTYLDKEFQTVVMVNAGE